MNATTVLLWMIALCFSIVILMIFSKPLKFLIRFLLQALLSALGFFVLNFFFSPFGLAVGINLLTISIAGVLGIPGFVSLYFMQLIL